MTESNLPRLSNQVLYNAIQDATALARRRAAEAQVLPPVSQEEEERGVNSSDPPSGKSRRVIDGGD